MGGDGQARGHGEADAGHFSQVGALAAQQFLLRGIAFGCAATEPENRFHCAHTPKSPFPSATLIRHRRPARSPQGGGNT